LYKTFTNIGKKEHIRWFTILLLMEFSTSFANLSMVMCYKVAHYSINKLNKFIKIHKDFAEFAKKNVVYQIERRDCDTIYVGQTGRKLKNEISRTSSTQLIYSNHIHRVTSTRLVITNHRVSCNYDFDWDNMRILNSERNYNKRL